ncbi:hypothetical protein BRADO5519 [Bradyrhizobium sp. ORS 278]|uniref:hypothetical protein n=1 Tax=Bradyrhizobium sp. (strain ORS 278) TaxID=114615 RepID=UPI00015087C9|nr:hypothetical protein [Bradyrhizobium sp. ORS 278]CAL79194.1 hypothetical protein BRADO5519 [Bradyrhizobium sp. ORS 278]
MTKQPPQQQSPFDKEPAEGSRETIDKQLAQQEQSETQGTPARVTVPERGRS